MPIQLTSLTGGLRQKQWDGLLLTLTASQCARLKMLIFQSQNEKESVMKLGRVGVDLAKNVYQLHGVDRHGKTVWKRPFKRS